MQWPSSSKVAKVSLSQMSHELAQSRAQAEGASEEARKQRQQAGPGREDESHDMELLQGEIARLKASLAAARVEHPRKA